ncbi:MAG: M28 family peptidase [Clostridiales bacterium]|jgi:hypothetical protein|nr:M28 family peptidase [Clostridiales bacterium]
MKTFTKIYYPVLAVFFALMFAFAFADAYGGGAKNGFDAEFYPNADEHLKTLAAEGRNVYNAPHLIASRGYILNYLANFSEPRDEGMNAVDGEDGMNDAEIYAPSDGVPKPTTAVQTAIVSQETQKRISSLKGGVYAVEKTVNNIILYVPGSVTRGGGAGDAVLLTAHYDSVKNGAMDNASSVSAMLETARYIVEGGAEYKNDLLFAFTDAEEEGMFGAYALMYQFKGFNNAVSRVKFAANFDSLGNAGSLLMFQSTPGYPKLISTYRKLNGGTFTSSIADTVYNSMSNFTDFEAFGDVPALNFANVGGTAVYHTDDDNAGNASRRVIKEQATMMYKLCDFYGGYDLNNLTAKGGGSVFFSYFDITTVSYPFAVAYAVGGVMLALVAAIVVLNRRKKAFAWRRAGAGAFVQALTLAATVAALYAAYFLINLTLALFGVIPVRAIGGIRYANPAIITGALLMAGALAAMFYIVFKRAFAVKATDVVRGNALLFALFAVALSFAAPALSYIFAVPALLQLCVMLLYVLFKQKYRQKFSRDFERLFLYTVPVILSLPLVIPVVVIAAAALSSAMLPVITVLFLLAAGTILPHADKLKPALDVLAKRLPAKKVRYESTVTEPVEDKAKKGKFTMQTFKRVEVQKTPWNYKNRFGIALVCVIAALTVIFGSSFGPSFNANIYGPRNVNNLVYDNSVVYVWENDSAGTATKTVEIHDLTAYKYFAEHVRGYKWNGGKKAYVKEYNNKVIDTDNLFKFPDVNKTGSVYTFTTFESNSRIVVDIAGAANVTKFIFNAADRDADDDYDGLVYDNTSAADSLTFRLPYGYGGFTMTVETVSDASPSLDITYTEECIGSALAEDITDVELLREKFAGDGNIGGFITASVILKYTKTAV